MSYNPDSIKMNLGRVSGRENYKSSEVNARPTGDPKSRKDFKKVLNNEENEDDTLQTKEIIEESDGTALAIETKMKKKVPQSLFDLTSGKAATLSEETKDANTAIESPSSVYAKLTSAETKKTGKELFTDTPEHLQPLEKDRFTTRFSTEQTDLSYVNPLAANTLNQPTSNLSIASEKTTLPTSNIQAIINQMIEKIAEMKNAGKTETVISLKHPPLFEGANIILTGFDSAKNEFNISIENLTQAGKLLLDERANKESLLFALEQKGYAVHILTTTTLLENRLTTNALPQEEQQRNDQQREKEGQREERGQQNRNKQG